MNNSRNGIKIDAISVNPSLMNEGEFSVVFEDYDDCKCYEISFEGAGLHTVAVWEMDAYGKYTQRTFARNEEASSIVKDLLFETSCGFPPIDSDDGFGKEKVIDLLLSYL